MPLLTDRKEPEDFDPPPTLEEPNEYAIRYLFNPNRNPISDVSRAGRVLVLAGAIGTVMAWLVMAANLELRLDGLLWLASVSMLGLQLLAWQRTWFNKRQVWLAFTPAILLTLALLANFLFNLPQENSLGQMVYFIPPSLASLLGGIFLVFVVV